MTINNSINAYAQKSNSLLNKVSIEKKSIEDSVYISKVNNQKQSAIAQTSVPHLSALAAIPSLLLMKIKNEINKKTEHKYEVPSIYKLNSVH